MPESNSQLPVNSETRVDKIEQIVHSLSDFEQDELRMRLSFAQLQDTCVRLQDWRNSLAIGLHTMMFAGVSFGLFTGLFMAITFGLRNGFTAAISTFAYTAVFGGFLFGLCMAAYMVASIRFFMPRLTKNLGDRRSVLFQLQETSLPLPAREALEVCITALSATKGTRLEAIDRENGTVRAVLPMSWRSPGELVGAKVDAASDDISRIRVYSRALYTGLDLGKTRANVVTLTRLIEESGHAQAVIRSS
jgi:hypothetical protein